MREGTILDPETTYWVVVNEGVQLLEDRISYTFTSGDGQTGEDDWSIGNGFLSKNFPARSWSTGTTSLLIAVRGRAAAPVDPTDATLREIVVNKNEGNDLGDEIALEPAFSSDRTSYSFVVGYESSSFVTVRTTHPRATVTFFVGWQSHREGEPAHYSEAMVESLGGGRWSDQY